MKRKIYYKITSCKEPLKFVIVSNLKQVLKMVNDGKFNGECFVSRMSRAGSITIRKQVILQFEGVLFSNLSTRCLLKHKLLRRKSFRNSAHIGWLM